MNKEDLYNFMRILKLVLLTCGAYMFQQEGRLFQIWYMDNFVEMNKQKSMLTMQWFIHKYIRNLNLSLFGIKSLKEKMLPKVEQTKHKPLKLF